MKVNEEIEEGISFGALEETDLFGNPVPTEEVEENEEPAEDVLLEEKNEEDEETTEPKEKEVKATKADKAVKKESKEDLAFSFEDEEEEVEGSEGSTTEDGGKDYSQLAKTLVESGTWQEFEIEGEDKTIDKATFEELKKQQLSKQKDTILDEYLDSEDKEFIEFKKTGGDLKEYINTYKVKEQVESLDISSDQRKQSAVYSYYKNIVGWSADKANKFVDNSIDNMTIDDEAVFAKEKLEEESNKRHEKVKESNRERNEEIYKERARYKGDIEEQLVANKIKGKKANQIVRDFTETGENNLNGIDEMYLNMKNNPEKVVFLWNMLKDTENYVKSLSQKTVNENNLDTFKGIVFNKKKKTTGSNRPNEGSSSKGIILK